MVKYFICLKKSLPIPRILKCPSKTFINFFSYFDLQSIWNCVWVCIMWVKDWETLSIWIGNQHSIIFWKDHSFEKTSVVGATPWCLLCLCDVNFMRQIGRCLWMTLPFKSVNSEWADCPPYGGWASSNQLKAWIKQKEKLPEQKGVLQYTAFRLCLPYWLSRILSLLAHVADLGLSGFIVAWNNSL